MKHSDARAVVEELRLDTRLWLPPLSDKRGFSSTRVEHLLNKLVQAMPEDEVYLEVGSLEGRTLEAAANGNDNKKIFACDPGSKYASHIGQLPKNIRFHEKPWQECLPMLSNVGIAFYDGDHSTEQTYQFLCDIPRRAADDFIVVLDDWDRQSVREAVAKRMAQCDYWRLIAEMPEYGDGLTCPPQRFGYQFGIGVLGWKV